MPPPGHELYRSIHNVHPPDTRIVNNLFATDNTRASSSCIRQTCRRRSDFRYFVIVPRFQTDVTHGLSLSSQNRRFIQKISHPLVISYTAPSTMVLHLLPGLSATFLQWTTPDRHPRVFDGRAVDGLTFDSSSLFQDHGEMSPTA